ncbi:MAG TPA: hypothetical protein VE621_18340 [Bryobacteraceae bacterium]|jgi:hypothetical protein|nr:hypothetical protein [Bryobacteraceae bacterium]
MSYTYEAIRAHLNDLYRSKHFAASARLRRFLDYIVERTLAGEGDTIKEFVIATEVYERGVEYDPQVDSTVRVEASRLRSKLRAYYEQEGAACAFRIQIPKGSYVPSFEPVAQEAAPWQSFVTAA